MLQQTNKRFGLTEANFRRFESVIQAAVLSYPQPIEVDWAQSDLRFTTYIARLRDALAVCRQRPSMTSWLEAKQHPALNALVVRPHPTNPSRILIGDHEATKTRVSPISNNFETSPIVGLLPYLDGRDKPPSFEPPKLRLSTSADPEMLQRAVVAYAELASMKVEGLPRLHLIRDDKEIGEVILSHLNEWTDGYDVAVQETEKEFIIL